MRKKLTEEEYPQFVAAHEMGHALAWRCFGFPLGAITLRGSGFNTSGSVSCAEVTLVGLEGFRQFLIGMVAGIPAGERWCEERNRHCPTSGLEYDLEAFRRTVRWGVTRFGPSAALVSSQLIVDARLLQRAYWPLLEKSVPLLAERRSLRI